MGALKTGGQGSVYKGRRVGEIITAVKLLPTPIHSETQDDKHFTAFQNEVNKLKKVNQQPNPHVVRILSSGITESGSFPYIEMEYVEGPDLEELLRPPHEPLFSIKEAIRVADQLSNALSHCHRVGVKHGDLKSNNVKYNVHTGNYVLLDFGMAIMSDEQRRTSLRHAGAIEFMAPEQNEGQILFQTDVYSFGVILFEMLAGSVPFPLRDGGQTSRHAVMLAHMETAPPDLVQLRRAALPVQWSEEKKDREMQVPQWLIDTIYTCLQKKPEGRYADGIVLHDHIIARSTQRSAAATAPSSDALVASLRQRVEQLQRENQGLHQQVLQLQGERQKVPPQAAATAAAIPVERRVHSDKSSWRFLPKLLLLFLVLVGGYVLYDKFTGSNNQNNNPVRARRDEPQKVIGQFRVLAERAYFYNEPDEATRRNAFMVPSNETVQGLREENGFIYTEFTNNRGQTSKGWLLRKDLVTLEEWRQRQQKEEQKELSAAEVNNQLTQARTMIEDGQTEEALFIYNYLAEQEVPEAMYESGNLALQKINPAYDCGRAYDMVKKAADRNHAPAKRTLGFLYIFADNPEVLQINNYHNCAYERNVYRGTKLMMEAVRAGDTTARRLVEELNISSPENNPQ